MKYSFLLGIFVIIWLSNTMQASSQHNTCERKLLDNDTAGGGVQLHEDDPKNVVIDNGLVEITLSKAEGYVVGIKYNGIENVLDSVHELDDRGYWDVVWSKPGGKDVFDKVRVTKYSVVAKTEDLVEVSFNSIWEPSKTTVPLNVDKRYIVRRGSSGLYTYAIMERLKGMPEVVMDQFRVVFKLQPKFNYMVISDDKNGIMPIMRDREKGQPLAFPEAVLLTDPVNPELKGEVDDKYEYSMEFKDSTVHGWTTDSPSTGFWLIRPSNEFCHGGPTRAELTSHAGPIALSAFTSLHYGGNDMDTTYKIGEPWKKIFGPIFVYLNKGPTAKGYKELWEDAKAQATKEVESWPYSFVQSKDYAPAAGRGTVEGEMKIINEGKPTPASSAYVGLVPPGTATNWQFETKGYQFWTQADADGKFVIKNVLPGTYKMHAWVPGFIGEYEHTATIAIEAGKSIKLGVLNYQPPRNGPTIWEIGIPDRSAAEFFVPDPAPNYVNKLFNNPKDKYRQYGLWLQYNDVYPKGDLEYDVATSNYSKDWFFAHVPRSAGANKFERSTWKVNFELKDVSKTGNYTLQIAIAAANSASLEVRMNDPELKHRPVLKTGGIGTDNAIGRHGIHGLYWLFSNIPVPSDQLLQGKNTLFLTQARVESPLAGHMYDYLRLEGPSEAPKPT